METSPQKTRLKNIEGKPERESPKRTISVSDGLGALQMVSEPNTGRCASEEADPQRGMYTRRCTSKDAEPQRGGEWIGGSHIDWRR